MSAWVFWLLMLAGWGLAQSWAWAICRGATAWDEAMRRALEQEAQ